MKILFLCVANSARSQMAEGIARNDAGTVAYIVAKTKETQGRTATVMTTKGIKIWQLEKGAIDLIREAGYVGINEAKEIMKSRPPDNEGQDSTLDLL